MDEVRVGLLGFGNVARAFCRHILGNASLQRSIRIVAVSDSSGSALLREAQQLDWFVKHKSAGRTIRDIAPDNVIEDIREFLEILPRAGVQVLVESLPTNLSNGLPGVAYIRTALLRGIHVVTVDKGPIVHAFDELNQTARARGARLEFSGTLGVQPPPESFGCRLLEIRGVFNGTTNYILSQMQEHELSLDQALRIAQAEGIAESDPSLDLEGWDTACKILIHAKTLMGSDASLADVSRRGIGPQIEALIQTARSTGRVVRLLARARIWQGRVRVSVAPKLVKRESPFFALGGTSKGAVFKTLDKGEFYAVARSGLDAVSQIILDDIFKVTSRGAQS